MYEEYEEITNKYIEEYGEKTVVIYNVGQFYEILTLDEQRIKLFGELLDIQITKRDKSLPMSRKNPMMVGFPIIAVNKYKSILVNANFTVIVVDQTKTGRAVTEVISAGTCIDSQSDTNNIVSIYIDEFKDNYSIGFSVADLTTGKCSVAEYYSDKFDIYLPFDSAYKSIVEYNPREILIFGNITNLTYSDICTKLQIADMNIHNKLNNGHIPNIAYQELILRKVYPKHGLLSAIEYINLERKKMAAISFTYLVDFVIKHNYIFVKNLEIPADIVSKCTIQYNAIKQLNIVESRETKSCLLNILNKCVTAIGRRKFRTQLLNPITDIDELNRRYDMIEYCKYDDIRKKLMRTYDIEKLVRKVAIGKIMPSNFIQIDITLDIVSSMGIDVSEIKNTYINILNMSEIYKDDFESSFIMPNINADIDKIQNEIAAQYDMLNSIAAELGSNFKLEINEKDGVYFTITKKRFSNFDNTVWKFTTQSVSASSSVFKVKHPKLNSISDNLIRLKLDMHRKMTPWFESYISNLKWDMRPVIDFIAEQDIISTHAYNAATYKYYRPKFGEDLIMREIRHPIIEQIQTDLQYVTNDVVLDNDTRGILLFGLNCSGKTSLSKAIAINIIMAQCGSFVPCLLTFKPFNNIFTRIPSGDDIYRGMSTFAVEMNELRNILRRADENSCIVGDEISHGTEVNSGVAIVSAALIELSKLRSKFIFATHLHTITEIPQIKALTSVVFKHLHVYYDGTKLIYDRKLRDGPGSSLYGIEVCKALGMSDEFINTAQSIRHNFVAKKSHYNASVYIDKCMICGSVGQEIHHIKPQSQADESGFIGNIHKNDQHNLMSICSTCHDLIHNGELDIIGYVLTSNGKELMYAKK